MSTRKYTYPLSISLWLLGAASALAGDFSMASGMLAQSGSGVDTIRNVTMEPSSRASLGGDSTRDMRGAMVDSNARDDIGARAMEDSPEATPGAGLTTPAASSRAIPAATPTVPSRARSSNRWQSLVPGAIK